jgi:hypothetical protein
MSVQVQDALHEKSKTKTGFLILIEENDHVLETGTHKDFKKDL